ncbi:Ubiquitin carboxyl-terminal hydrolase [Thalictrum thalictroides]|uniref:Ubiquitin carboxyl-terminal hydrolase n=1 Tax=Thalictrum thalictroides TaxID=46969 RepID=A0A7J6UZI9_THATH|nr:Ubiquitin carboxyl-terminal hydrolase [Thalictrum thalictroides]
MEEMKGGEGVDVLFQRRKRIEFHPARKPFLGFSNNNHSDFHLETLNPTTSEYSHNNKNHTPSSLFSLTNSTAVKKLSDSVDFFDFEFCLNGTTFRRIGAGLENLGNTCFLNSVLQCLTYTEPFAAYLQSGMHKSSCHTSGFCALCAIQNHVKRALQSTGRIVAPKDLVVNLRCISRSFRNARQEDAHEYMVNLLESMHRCCLPSGVPSESPSAYEKSLVHKIFGGRLRSQVKCIQCSYCSNTFDPFLDLSLEITKADSLVKALTHFTAVEQLDGGERQYQCQRCNKKVKALKQLTVNKAPYVLSIHLKRFGSHVPGQKIDKKVEFGPTLNLKPFVSGSYEGELKYTLYGVLVHAGWSTHSGHYYCFVRTSSGMWHSLDDNRVVQVSEKTVMQQKAYMLFYVRDRRNLAPKKAIDRMETIIPNAIKNNEQCASVESKQAVQIGPVATGLCTIDLSKKTQKESSLVKIATHVAVAQKSSDLKDLRSQSSKALVKGHVDKQISDCHSVEEVCPQPSVPFFKGNLSTSNPNVPSRDKKPDLEYLHQESKALSVLPSSGGSQISGSDKLAIVKIAHKNNSIPNDGISSEEPYMITNDHKKIFSKKNFPAKLLKQTGIGNNQNECERVPIENSCQKVEVESLTSIKTRLTEPSTKSDKRNACVVDKEALGHHHNLQKTLKPKKKTMKLRFLNMHLGPKFLRKTSLNQYKKKKQKKNKQRTPKFKVNIQGSVEENSNSAGHPSTSKKTIDLALNHCNKRHMKKSSPQNGSGPRITKDVQKFIEYPVINVTEGCLRKRTDEKNGARATTEPPRKCSSLHSAEAQSQSREPDTSQKKRGLLENGFTSLLTRGSDFTVPRWDEIESSPQCLGSKDGESTNIGYVPDEWDEEYDRGKRKKVRKSKDLFDGSNPFQEIATKKAELKKAKLAKPWLGNQPSIIR